MKSFFHSVELAWRHVVVYPLLRLLFRNAPHDGAIDILLVRKLLILRYDRIGDIVVSTPVFRRLKEIHPGLVLGVLASEANAELIRTNPCVDRLHVLPRQWRRIPRFLLKVRSEEYDVVLNFIFNRTTSGGVLANLIAPRAIKVGQGAEKYRFYFNKMLKLERGERHMSEVLQMFIDEVFGLPREGKKRPFEIVPDHESQRVVAEFLQKHGLQQRNARKGFIVLNISAAEALRAFSPEQSVQLAGFLVRECREEVVVISAPNDRALRKNIASSAGEGAWEFPPEGDGGLLAVAAILGSAKCAITPDTSIVHIASAMKTPVLAFYTPLRVTQEWLPYGIFQRSVQAGDGEPVSALSAKVLKDSARSFLNELNNSRGTFSR